MKKLIVALWLIVMLSGTASAQGQDAFSWQLWDQIQKQSGNLFFSPLSIQEALGLAAAGANAGTAPAYRGLTPLEALAKTLKALQAPLQAKHEKLLAANGLWIQRGHHVLEAYRRKVQQAGCEIGELDFAGQLEAARQTINQWVAQHTSGHVKEILGALDPRTDIVLANAVFFQGLWEHGFSPKLTFDGKFTRADGQPVDCHMMRMSDVTFRYAEDASSQLLELPYQDGRLSMVLVLPRERVAPNATPGQLAALRDTPMDTVIMPRFKLHWRADLIPLMQALKLPLTGFDKIDGRPHRISQAVHEATVDVDESGTVASAATAIGMRQLSVWPRKPIFRADHPFMVIIRDRESGLVIFMGRVSDPASE
ncbi:MAG: serpin family protein [Candidatus Xenobia bacterium]